ncbi:hypothetical protein [Kitasatospora sp. NPDC059571]|uniref:hypothetical protein n=1 Tax=Kitasatospora sp. NPDC059571 TaxID=3346871 RepID=UPI00368FCFDA
MARKNGGGVHWVRGHYRRNPVPRVKKSSLWLVAAVGAVLWWIAPSGDGGATAPAGTPSAPATAPARVGH